MSSDLPQSSRLFDALLQKPCPAITTTTITPASIQSSFHIKQSRKGSCPGAFRMRSNRGTGHQVRSSAVCQVTLSDIYSLHHTHTHVQIPTPSKHRRCKKGSPPAANVCHPVVYFLVSLLLFYLISLARAKKGSAREIQSWTCTPNINPPQPYLTRLLCP